MAKINTGDIQDLTTPWENYEGISVERFIKRELGSACGYIYRTQQKEGDFYYLYGFHSYDDFVLWFDGDTSIIPLFKVALPNLENDIYAANLYTNSNTTKLVNLGQGIKINLRYTSTSTNPTTQVVTDTFNDGTLIIMRSANGSAYTEVGRITMQPIPHEQLDTYDEIDITPYLADGDNKIRLRVEDNTTGAVSNNIVFNSIINTTLKVTNATNTTVPLTALQFMYYIEGQVTKTLHIKITKDGVSDFYTFAIGTSTYIEAPYITPAIGQTYDSGMIEVEAWLSVDDTTLDSEHIVNQFYYSNGALDETVIVLNNKATTITNYSNVHFFDFILFNKNSDVNIKIQDQLNVYLDYTYNNCQINTEYSFYNILQINSEADEINAVMIVTTADDVVSYSIVIDNSENMSPTAGADFVLNPNLRNNNEANPNRIINDMTQTEVASTFTGFNFINDGWVSDEDGYKILRVPAAHSINIEYDPLDTLANGTTIELDYKVHNVFNDADTVLSFSSSTQDNKPLGFIMNAIEATFYTLNNQTKRDQDVVFQEDVRTHMAINIIPNLGNTGLNYIRIFINGVMNREMMYSNSDTFKTGTLSINIGSEHCDVDIYSIRVYKKALSAGDVRQDYMSTIPTLDEKLAFKEANDILSSNGTISFDKASVKYNTLVWVGNVPSYQTGDIEYEGKLKINKIDDPEHSGVITNLKCKGQGSSSKTYWKWNQQYDWNKISGKTTIWTDGTGETHTDGYRLTDEDPVATKLVAKLNWASSMQSHKEGSTSLYTDLWRVIVGGNSITHTVGYEDVRVSVHEEPFLFFVQDTESSTPVFYGLMTFGSGKFDKATFGYNKNVFPDYLIIEGTDNGMPLTLRQVPWFEDEVTYNDDEKYYQYAGQGNWDYGMGNQNMLHYFIDANNFVYQHALRLKPYTNDSELTDITYQYWHTATGNIVRYDYINEEWVNGGITKTNGVYDEFNIFTQTGLTPTGDSDADTEAFKQWRTTHFKNNIGTYYNVDDVLYSMAFLKFIAASDNRCKNTYEYLDPITHKICMAQDDMDTIMLTDNVGRKNKPYYVEEYDKDSNGAPYFNGSDNNFFMLMDAAYEAELQGVIHTIFAQMLTVEFGESAEACLQKYYYYVQEYFPAVAFNETARLLYEEASVAQARRIYSNGTDPISQSLGNQLEAEKQWFKRRLRYLQSWSHADPFDVRSVISPSLNFRAALTTLGTNPTYQFALTPWQWLYPKVGAGQSLGADNTRVPAQTLYNTITLTTSHDTDTFIYGADYYTSFGEFGDKSIGGSFQLAGRRLLEFSADSRYISGTYEFKPTSMTINCPVLKRLSLYGCQTLTGGLDLSLEKKLNNVNLRNTNLTDVVLPETETLKTIYMAGISSLYLMNCPNVTTISITNYSHLLSLTTDNSTLALNAVNNAQNLNRIDFRNIDINVTNASASDRMYSLLVDTNNRCTGHVQLNKTLTAVEKDALVVKYGNIDSSENALYVQYTLNPASSITIDGKASIAQGRTQIYSVQYSGNDAISYNWTVTNAESYTANGKDCEITAKSDSFADISVSVVMTRVDNNPLNASKTIAVVENVPISGIGNADVNLISEGAYNINIEYTPANHTTEVASNTVVMTQSNHASLVSYDTENIRIQYNSIVSNIADNLLVVINATDDDGHQVQGSFMVNLLNPITTLKLNGTTIWER